MMHDWFLQIANWKLEVVKWNKCYAVIMAVPLIFKVLFVFTGYSLNILYFSAGETYLYLKAYTATALTSKYSSQL